jgi:hypothetical protein
MLSQCFNCLPNAFISHLYEFCLWHETTPEVLYLVYIETIRHCYQVIVYVLCYTSCISWNNVVIWNVLKRYDRISINSLQNISKSRLFVNKMGLRMDVRKGWLIAGYKIHIVFINISCYYARYIQWFTFVRPGLFIRMLQAKPFSNYSLYR